MSTALLALGLTALLQAAPEPFERADAQSQGLEPRAIEALDQLVQSWVASDAVVGAEWAVIRRDRLVHHAAFGWRDRESQQALTPGSIYCLRSMTKPVVGAAAQLLLADGRLKRDSAVAEHLAPFDSERTRAITVEHLLTHSSGLGLSSLPGRNLVDLGGLDAIVELAAAAGPAHAPGSAFRYSDDGADVLGALLAQRSGASLEELLRNSVLAPCGMDSTSAAPWSDPKLRERLCSAYIGEPGAWRRYYAPGDPAPFPFLLASQGLYGSVLDYAAFLRLWQGRRAPRSQFALPPEQLARALTPRHRAGLATGFRSLECWYGELMTLWIDPAAPAQARVVAFGHGGSDGTKAWAFPQLELTVLYFTQCRNTGTLVEFESALERELVAPLRGRVQAGPRSYAAGELAEFAGDYWEADDQRTQHVTVRDGALWLERPGSWQLELVAAAERDRFHLRLSAATRVEFERDERGRVIALKGSRSGGGERLTRIDAPPPSPTLAELLAAKREHLGESKLAQLGPVRAAAQTSFSSIGLTGSCELMFNGLAQLASTWQWQGPGPERLTLNGPEGWRQPPGGELAPLDAAARFEALVDHPLLPLADWSELYAELRVLARFEREERALCLVRGVPAHGAPHTWTLDATSGEPLSLQTQLRVPGLGEVGLRVEYSDWRELGGVKLPQRQNGRFSRALGEFESRWTSCERAPQLPPETFARPRQQ